MNDVLGRSWSSMTRERAAAYMKTFGHPAESSKELLVDVLERTIERRPISILELGCGNGQIYEYMLARGLACVYTGIDFSEPLLDVARSLHEGDRQARFLHGDVNDLSGLDGDYDVAIYSQVLEALGSPEASLRHARDVARKTIIRFFEPPDHDVDWVELREMDVGGDKPVPYIRRKMSRDYYRLILAGLGCTAVDVYKDDRSRDQVHVLHYQ